jgi:hypothetical protein
MGGFKESMAPTSSRGAWTPTTRTDGRSWVDASPSRRCAVCGGDSWCQTHREGGTVLCKRVGNGGREKMNRDGVMYWVHRLSVLKEQVEYWAEHRTEKLLEVIPLFYDTILDNGGELEENTDDEKGDAEGDAEEAEEEDDGTARGGAGV